MATIFMQNFMQNFGGTKKEYYGIFESGLFFIQNSATIMVTYRKMPVTKML